MSPLDLEADFTYDLLRSKVAKLYQFIWLDGGSPLLVYSLRQKQKLAELLPNIAVEIGM